MSVKSDFRPRREVRFVPPHTNSFHKKLKFFTAKSLILQNEFVYRGKVQVGPFKKRPPSSAPVESFKKHPFLLTIIEKS